MASEHHLHKQVEVTLASGDVVKCDEGVAELVAVIYGIPGVIPRFSCQGHVTDVEIADADRTARQLLSAYISWAEADDEMSFFRRLKVALGPADKSSFVFTLGDETYRGIDGRSVNRKSLHFLPSAMPQVVASIKALAAVVRHDTLDHALTGVPPSVTIPSPLIYRIVMLLSRHKEVWNDPLGDPSLLADLDSALADCGA
jgi:hypothetical protein